MIVPLISWFKRGGSLFVYNSYIPTTEAEQAFAVLFTSQSGSNRFTSSAAKLELFIRQRILPSALPLTYVDGAVMELYSKVWFVRREMNDIYMLYVYHTNLLSNISYLTSNIEYLITSSFYLYIASITSNQTEATS